MARRRHAGERRPGLPREPIHRVTEPLTAVLHVDAASGIVLLVATFVALTCVNSGWAAAYLGLWTTPIGISFGDFEFRHSLKHLINDGLMAIFFFVVGLEVKLEIVMGELRQWRTAVLPLAAAIGGMIVPAGIYLAMQYHGEAPHGWGIPMATDIAFVVGCLALLGSRIPYGLRILLLSLAIADDIGAILVIAVGYTKDLQIEWLLVGIASIVIVLGMARLGIRGFLPYTLVGVVIWFAFHESGIHATIAGVILGMLTPAKRYVSPQIITELGEHVRNLIEGSDPHSPAGRAEELRHLQHVARETISPLEYLERLLHPWVGFVVMPLFALANAGIRIDPTDVVSPISLAVILGLAVGKPVGIASFCWLTVRAGLAELPRGVTWPMIIGGGCLAGIGFTMAIFIAELALEESQLQSAKLGVLTASVASAIVGMTVLVVASHRRSMGGHDNGDAC